MYEFPVSGMHYGSFSAFLDRQNTLIHFYFTSSHAYDPDDDFDSLFAHVEPLFRLRVRLQLFIVYGFPVFGMHYGTFSAFLDRQNALIHFYFAGSHP